MIRPLPAIKTLLHTGPYLSTDGMHHLLGHRHVTLVLEADDGLAIKIVPRHAQESGNGARPRVPRLLYQRV